MSISGGRSPSAPLDSGPLVSTMPLSEEHDSKVNRPAEGEPTIPRVALVVASMAVGGAERVALNLAEEFVRRGLGVDLVLVDADGPLLRHVPPAVRIVDLGARRARQAILKLRRYVKAEKPSAIIAFTFHINILALLATSGIRSGPRLILSVHSSLSSAISEKGFVAGPLLLAQVLLLYHRAYRVVAVSEGAAADLRNIGRLPRELISTIYNPIVRADFHSRLGAPPAHPWAAGEQRPLVVAVGRLTRAKDFSTLVLAFAKVVREHEARLLILGEGEERGELEALVSRLGLGNSVAMPGQVDDPLPYMRAADAFVLSSRREGFGNVLVEAMAAGARVISTDCPHGPNEILENGKWGKLVPIGDPDALSSAILAVLRDGGVDGRSRAGDFTVEAATEQYLSLVFGSGQKS